MKLKDLFNRKKQNTSEGEKAPRKPGRLKQLRRQIGQRFSVEQRLAFFAVAGLLNGLVLAMLCRCIEKQSLAAGFAAWATGGLWLTALFIGFVGLSIALLTRQLLAGAVPTALVTVILSIINYYKVNMTATPLGITDFVLITKLGSIATLNSEAISISAATVISVLLVLVWLVLMGIGSYLLDVPWLSSAMFGLGTWLVTLLVFWVGADSVIFRPLGESSAKVMEQSVANELSSGPILGLWRSFYVTCHTENLNEDYSAASIEDVMSAAEELTGGDAEENAEEDEGPTENPNIILILSESFFDVTTLPGVEFEEDPLEDFHELQEESISGTFYTRSLGYGTCNIELEVLTGINSGLLGGEDLYSYDPSVFGNVTAVPELLRENGYYTAFLHPYPDNVYDRTHLFEEVGFDDMYFWSDFDAFYEPLAEAGSGYYGWMKEHISGKYYSDDLLADLLIAKYEYQKEEDEDQPVLLYAASMENHQPYLDKYDDSEITVEYTTDVKLSEEADNNLVNIAQGCSNASAMLGKLVDYFKDCDQPTIIVFYGDHRPGAGLTDGGSLWTELGMVDDDNMAKWSLEDYESLYSTSYLIWSNDESLLPGTAGEEWDTSCNYLGSQILDAANVEEPVYWKLLTKLSETRIIDTTAYHLSRDGELTDEAPQEGEDATELRLLTALLQDAVYGEGYARSNGTGVAADAPEAPVESLYGEITLENWDEAAINAALGE